MVCLACSTLTGNTLCDRCELGLRPAPEQFLPGVGVVRPGFRHQGTARILVHHLKYRGVIGAGERLAEAMAEHVPAGVVLVPVLRLGWRRLRYGIDPALELARSLGRLTGIPVVAALQAPFLGRTRAGRAHGFAPGFRRGARNLRRPVLLVDDVITTGATLGAAASLFAGVEGAVTATTSGRIALTRATDAEWTSLPGGGHHTE